MRRPSEVVFIDEKLETLFDSLVDSDVLKKSLVKAIMGLQQDAFAGIQVPKRLIPKEYIQKYGINNLWKYNLPGGWRLLYTITAKNRIELITAILEWFDHKEYERRMRY